MKWNTQAYNDHHGFVAKYGEAVLALLDPQPGERILDIGSGTGGLTQKIAASGACAVGLDSSPEMIEAARAAFPEIKFCLGHAADFSLETLEETEPFDAIFSNAALHRVTRMEDAVICMARVLRCGGRFVVEFGGKGNIEKITRAFEAAAREQCGVQVEHGRIYPSIAEYSSLLEKHGIAVGRAELFDRPTRLENGEDGLDDWLRQFNRAVLEQLPQEKRESVIASTRDKLRDEMFHEGHWIADYRRLRIEGTKM